MTALIEMTDNGLIYMSENEIYQAIIDKHLEIDPNWNLDVSTHDGYMTAWHAENYRILIEAIASAYNSKDPNKARDTQLNIIGALTGATREDGTPTIINITVSGTDGTTVSAGAIIEIDGVQYSVDNDLVIGTANTGTATCAETGVIEPTVGSDVTIKTTIGGWSGCSIDSIETLGTNKQSNASFRLERRLAVARPGSNQTDSTVGELFAVADVKRVAAYENPTGSAAYDAELNPHSLPANSESYVVLGGTDEDCAQAIYNKKNPGVFLNQVGDPVSVYVESKIHKSNGKTIKFGRPTAVDMIHVIELSDPLGNLPANIETLIQNAIIDYTNGELIELEDGFDDTGFDIGEDVPIRRMDTPINYVIGQYKGAYISTSTINTLTSGAVTIAFNEISNWTAANISVSVV